VDAAIVRGRPDELIFAVLAAALYGDDPAWAESVCLRLAEHEHYNVRGNAVLGFGHIARIHQTLDPSRVLPVLEAALRDQHEYVRAQADAAMDDVEHFLGWRTSRPNPVRDWYDGKTPPGVLFSLNQPVRIATGPHVKQLGSVVVLLSIVPEPRYVVELADGHDIQVGQEQLEPL